MTDAEKKPREYWKSVDGYSKYEISNLGRLRSTFKMSKHIFSLTPNCRGYVRVCLYGANKKRYAFVHTLVLEAFVGKCPKGLVCGHKNGVKTDNRLLNLYWISHTQNAADKIRHNKTTNGERHSQARLTDAEAIAIKKEYIKTGYNKSNTMYLAKKFGVSRRTIATIVAGKRKFDTRARAALKEDEEMG